jgi:Helix-turn-helix domain of resolvase
LRSFTGRPADPDRSPRYNDRTRATGFPHVWRIAEFERSLIRERTQAGLAAARRIERTGGRPPKLTDDDIKAAKAMLANPGIGVTQIAHRLGVPPAALSIHPRRTNREYPGRLRGPLPKNGRARMVRQVSLSVDSG